MITVIKVLQHQQKLAIGDFKNRLSFKKKLSDFSSSVHSVTASGFGGKMIG